MQVEACADRGVVATMGDVHLGEQPVHHEDAAAVVGGGVPGGEDVVEREPAAVHEAVAVVVDPVADLVGAGVDRRLGVVAVGPLVVPVVVAVVVLAGDAVIIAGVGVLRVAGDSRRRAAMERVRMGTSTRFSPSLTAKPQPPPCTRVTR